MVSKKYKPPRSALGLFWDALGPWGKRSATILPIFALMAILAPWASSMIGTPPFANKGVEMRVLQVEQRIDLSERIAVQREVLKLEEEAKRRALTAAEKNYLQDLKDRLRELEGKRK